MFILNASLSHKSNDWLIDVGSVQTRTPFGYWIITRVVELGLGLVYMYGKLRHRLKTFMRVQDLKVSFSSSNGSNNGEVGICPTTQTLFSVQPISRVLEVQICWFLFFWKVEKFSRTFMKITCSNSDVSNDILFRQENKNCHQVKIWSLTQQLVIKSIVPDIGL